MTDERGTVNPDGTIHDRRRRAYWQQTGMTPRWQLLLVYVMIVMVSAVGLWQTNKAANQAEDAAMEAQHATEQIQANRIELCEDINTRHDATIAELDRQIAELPPLRRRQAQARRASTVALINALSPRRDCEAILTPSDG